MELIFWLFVILVIVVILFIWLIFLSVWGDFGKRIFMVIIVFVDR